MPAMILALFLLFVFKPCILASYW